MAAGWKMKGLAGGGLAAALVAVAFVMAFGGEGCEESTGGEVQAVKIGDRWFHLEVVADAERRLKGLSGRTHIEPDGGMLFVFPSPLRTGFVMRDCPNPIDIIYLSPEGRIVAKYGMLPEEPRGPDEGQPGEIHPNYEERLKKYDSRYPTQFVIELRGGTLPDLRVKEGDRIELPYADLKRRAR